MNDDGQMVDKNQKYLVSMGDYSKTCMHYHVKSDHVLTKWALGVEVMNANWKIARKTACLFDKEIYCPQCSMVVAPTVPKPASKGILGA